MAEELQISRHAKALQDRLPEWQLEGAAQYHPFHCHAKHIASPKYGKRLGRELVCA